MSSTLGTRIPMNPATVDYADLTGGQRGEIRRMIEGGNDLVDLVDLPHKMVAATIRSKTNGMESVFVLHETGAEYRVY